MKSPAKLLALVAALSALASVGFANGIVQFGHDNSNYRSGSGGEFTVQVQGTDTDHIMDLYPTGASGTKVTFYNSSNVASGVGIETFCLQKTEYMSFNGTFYYGVSTAARGGSGYTPDEISVGTAWLYAQFAQGLLYNYHYTPGSTRAADAVTLQHAIWYLEGEEDYASAGGAGNYWLGLLTTSVGSHGAGFSSLSYAMTTNAGTSYGVEVLNLATSQANANAGLWDAQDQLIWPQVPDSATTVALLGLSLIGLAGFRRKFVK